VDQLRVAIPEEVRAAKRINAEGERIVEKAQEEATRIVSRAQEQAAFLIGERGLTEAAEDESRRIVARAEADGEEVRRGADEYAVGVLLTLESEVVKALAGIRKGIGVLDERRAELAADDEAPGEQRAEADEDEADLEAEEDEDRARRPVLR
jgi:F0F1-type ATP synthase membrane subunit b/b'